MNALEMAKKMERDAIQFYAEAAKKTKYPAGKKMFFDYYRGREKASRYDLSDRQRASGNSQGRKSHEKCQVRV